MSSFDDRFIVISKKGEENLILNWIDFEGKTVKEIREKYLSENQNLLITNNLYSELLDNSEKPSELYPQLALAQYPDQYLTPQNCLSIIDNDFDFEIKFQIVCQEKEPKIDFPPLNILFKRSNFLNCEDIFKYVSEKLTFSHFDDKFFQDSVEISPDTSPTIFFENSKKSPIYFHTTFADSAFKKLYYRQNILKEIISTENTYVNDLRALIDYWKPGMKRTNYFTDQEISFFFGDLHDILKLHVKFKKSLEERGTEYSSLVSDIFLKFSALFSVSKRFISTYAIFTYILNEKAQTNKNSSSILQNLAKMNTFEGDRDFTSYLITPVQRMPRYMLFLRELAKYSPSEHPDFQFLDKAMKSIVSVTQDIDLFSNSSRQIAQIMTNFSKPLFIFKEGRNLIEMATVYVSQSPTPFDPYSTGTLQTITAPKEGYLYLFNDSILLTTIDQISSPKSKDSPNEFTKYPENPLFLKDLHHFKYFPHPDSIEFSLRDKRAKKGVNHFLIYFKKRTDCFDYLEKLENQRMGLKSINNENPWILWQNKFFDLRPKINSKQLNRPIKFTKILPSAYTQGTSSTFSEGSQLFHFFFGGESREKTNSQLVTIKDDRNMSFEIESIENNSPNIYSRSGHSLCSDGKDIYVFGGKKSNYDFFDDLWKFETETKTWQLLTPRQTKPSKRAFHCCCFYHSPSTNKQTITVFGGLGEKKKPLDDIAVFDFDTCNWTIYELFNSPSQRYSMGSCVCNESFLIVVGGRDERYVFNDVYSFDLAHKMWKKIIVNGETVFPRFGHKLVDVGDWVVTVGGASFEEVFVDHNSTRMSENEKDKNDKKNGHTFLSLPPTAINIKTGKSFNIDEFGNAPQSLVGFGIVKLSSASKNSNDETQNKNDDKVNNEDNKKESEAVKSDDKANNEDNKKESEAVKSDDKANNEDNKKESEAVKSDDKVNNEDNKKESEAVENDVKINNDDHKSSNIEANNSINEDKNNETNSSTENNSSTQNNESSLESDSISRFLVFGGFEDGFNASRNAWFTIDIPNNLTELIEGPKPKPIEPEPQTEKEKENEPQKTPDVQLPINNEVISNTEEIIHVDISKKLNDELEKESILINQQDNENQQEINEQSIKETKENTEQINQTEKLENEVEDKNLTQKEEEKEKVPKEEEKQNEKEEEKQNEKEEEKQNEKEEEKQNEKEEEKQKQKENEKEEEKGKVPKEVEKQNEKEEEKGKVPKKEEKQNENEKEKVPKEEEISEPTNKVSVSDQDKDNNNNFVTKKQETETKEQQQNEKQEETQKVETETTNEIQISQEKVSSPIQQDQKENNKYTETVKQQQIKTEENKQNQEAKKELSTENKTQHQTIIKVIQSEDEQKQQLQKSPDKEDENKGHQIQIQQPETEPKSNEENHQEIQNSKDNNNKEEEKKQFMTPKTSQTQQIQSSKVNNVKETKQQFLTPKINNENETKIKHQIETPKPDNDKENKHFQTPKINQTQQMHISEEKQQIQTPKNTQNLSQTKNDSQQKEKQIQKQQDQKINQQKNSNQKQIQTQNRQRKSIEPQKSTANNAVQKRPIQGQKQNQQRTQKQPQKYQKRQTLEPNKTNAVNKISNNTNNYNKKPIQQNQPRRKTTFYENYMTKRMNEIKSDNNKQESNEATKTKTTTKTVTTKTSTKSSTTTKAAVARDSSSSMTKNTETTKAIRSTASRQPNQQRRQLQKSNQQPQKGIETQHQKQQQQHQHAEADSIFDFKRVIDKKLASLHSNLASIGSQTQDSQPVFKQPSMSEDDAALVSQLGVDLTNFDLFSRKLVSRRLKHAVEASTETKTRTKTERLESAFVVSFTANQNENNQEQNNNANFTVNDNVKTDEGADFAAFSPSFSEIDLSESVSLLASRMQALTDRSGRRLFLCGFDVPFDTFKKAVMEKD